MEVQIRVIGGDDLQELAALREWLHDEPELRGDVAAVDRPIGESELGAALDMVTIALSSSSAGVALSRSLTTWLRTRRPDVKITVTTAGRTLELEATNLPQALPLLQEALHGDDGS